MKIQEAQLNFLAMMGILFLAIEQALGCACPRPHNPHPQQQVCNADFVIRGEVLKKDLVAVGDDFDSVDIKYTVKVKRIYKGEEFMPESGRRIIDIMGMAFCDPGLEKGEVYLISVLFDDYTEQLKTDGCLWNVEWSQITQGQRQGLKHFYEKYCQKCEIAEGVAMPFMLPNNMGGNVIPPPSNRRCLYQGGLCEKLHSSCIVKSTGSCGWTTNSRYRSCKELESFERR